MRLNTLQPAPGSKTPAKRLGRGIGSGKGKTCGRGHKGQRARAGGYHKMGFEGGQMPLQRRIPKSGFRSKKSLYRAEIRLSDLANTTESKFDLETLMSIGLINTNVKYVKIIGTGKIDRAITIKQLPITAGARKSIETAGGTIEA